MSFFSWFRSPKQIPLDTETTYQQMRAKWIHYGARMAFHKMRTEGGFVISGELVERTLGQIVDEVLERGDRTLQVDDLVSIFMGAGSVATMPISTIIGALEMAKRNLLELEVTAARAAVAAELERRTRLDEYDGPLH